MFDGDTNVFVRDRFVRVSLYLSPHFCQVVHADDGEFREEGAHTATWTVWRKRDRFFSNLTRNLERAFREIESFTRADKSSQARFDVPMLWFTGGRDFNRCQT